MVSKSLGIVLICEALAMLPSLLVSIIYKGNDAYSFMYTVILLCIGGLLLVRIKPVNSSIYARDGFAIVALGWILISFFGAMPFYFSGAIPSFINSFFESVSGFTTTGASILTQIEGLPRGILFWRSSTHWLGGMGVLTFTLAILPSVGARTFHIMKAESPGPTPGKIVPRIGQTAKILYGIYIMITLTEVVLLMLAGLPVFDAFIHTFGTVGTGGFSNMNLSVGAYNNVAVEAIITVFMLVCGTNFVLFYQISKGNIKAVFKNEEFRFYMGVVAFSILLITFSLKGHVYHSIGEALRYSTFQVASIVTTTGYATADFNQWPLLGRMILLILMFMGGSAGSTGGAIKQVRILLLLKVIKREIIKITHPRAVHSIRLGGKVVEEETVTGVLVFFFIYMLAFVTATIIVAYEGKDITTTVTSVIATLGNIGPGLEMVGPIGNYSQMSVLSKLVLSMCMFIGRLEIYPVLLIMIPSFWKRVNI